jgi:hypothetical protein
MREQTTRGKNACRSSGRRHDQLLVSLSAILVVPIIPAFMATLPIWKQAPKRPTIRPRRWTGAISAIYWGDDISALPKPRKNRPAMKHDRLGASACISAAQMTRKLPRKLTPRRPILSLSARNGAPTTVPIRIKAVMCANLTPSISILKNLCHAGYALIPPAIAANSVLFVVIQ